MVLLKGKRLLLPAKPKLDISICNSIGWTPLTFDLCIQAFGPFGLAGFRRSQVR